MLELILSGIAVTTTTGFLFRHKAYSALSSYAYRIMDYNEKRRYKELMDKYGSRLPEKGIARLRSQLYLVDVACQLKSFDDKKLLPAPSVAPISVEYRKEQQDSKEFIRQNLVPSKRSQVIGRPAGYVFNETTTAENVILYYNDNRRHGFLAFLRYLDFLIEDIMFFDEYYPVILEENREIISNIPEVIFSLDEQHKDRRSELRASLDYTLRKTIEKEKEAERSRTTATIEQYMNLLQKPDTPPQDEEKTKEEPTFIHFEKPYQFRELETQTFRELGFRDFKRMNIHHSLNDFFKNIPSDPEDFSFLMFNSFIERHLKFTTRPELMDSTFFANYFLEPALQSIADSSYGKRFEPILNYQYLSLRELEQNSSVFRAHKNYIQNTYLQHHKRANLVMMAHNNVISIAYLPSDFKVII